MYVELEDCVFNKFIFTLHIHCAVNLCLFSIPEHSIVYLNLYCVCLSVSKP